MKIIEPKAEDEKIVLKKGDVKNVLVVCDRKTGKYDIKIFTVYGMLQSSNDFDTYFNAEEYAKWIAENYMTEDEVTAYENN